MATVYLYLRFEKAAIKRETKWKMIAGMEKEELVLLKFSKKETKTKLRWEHDREFEYDGQMYDVVSKETKGDTIYYRCWWDHKETALNQKLEKLVAKAFNNSEDQQRTQKELNHYLQSFFCSEVFKWQAKPFDTPLEIFQNTLQTSTVYSRCICPPTPPPKFC